MTKIENNNKLIEALTHTIVVENTISICCGYISSLIKKGKMKSKFRFFSEITEINKEFLINHIIDLKAKDYTSDKKYNFCKADIEHFSLIGVVNLAMELVNVATKIYKILSNSPTAKKNRAYYAQAL